MEINDKVLNDLLLKAQQNYRRRMHLDMRDDENEPTQRMLNAMMPDTDLPIHRHKDSSEDIIILKGRIDEIFYDNEGKEIKRVHLGKVECEGYVYGVFVPVGIYHNTEVFEPSVIMECKSSKYNPLNTEFF